MTADPKQLLYRRETELGADGLASYYTQSGDGDSRKVSRSVWQAIQLVPAEAERVLDVGCHVGYMGQIMKAARPLEVVGIELDPAAAQAARQRLDQVVTADIERVESLPFPEGYFDCITMLDIVEHLILPQRALALLRRYLKPDGYLICSIPNVRHMSVIASLLIPGRCWTIEGGGMVTDPPHLRFFTLDDLLKLMADTGYQMESPVVGTASAPNRPFLLELLESLRGVSAISEDQRARLAAELCVFQFVFRARPAPAGAPQTVPEIQIVPNRLHRVDHLMERARLREQARQASQAAARRGEWVNNKLIDAADMPRFESTAHALQALRARFDGLGAPYSRHLADSWSRM